jgi:hypothetical protein
MGRVQRKVKGWKCLKIGDFWHFSGLKNGPILAPKIGPRIADSRLPLRSD